MDFLNKLYDSNYFGIGLFAVISFLVVTFLVVLFFGKKDEKRRQLQERKLNIHKIQNSFNEVSKPTSVEVPISPIPNIPVEPIAPISPIQSVQPTIPVEPIKPVNFESSVVPEVTSPSNNFNEPIRPIAPNFEPTFTESTTTNVPPVMPIMNNQIPPVVSNPEPVKVEPTRFDVPTNRPTPTVVEPIKINIPDPEPNPTPVVKPIIDNTPSNSNLGSAQTIIEEPEISGTYYKPVEADVPEEVKVPNIDFDAIAKSISEELEELEKTSAQEVPTRANYRESNNTQFSSVYVREQPRYATNEMDLPKTLDLPTKRDEY